MAGRPLLMNGDNGVVMPLGRTWRMVDVPNLSFETDVGTPKSRVRGEVNVKSVGFDGEGVPTGFDGDADADGVSRALVWRWVMLGELTREG